MLFDQVSALRAAFGGGEHRGVRAVGGDIVFRAGVQDEGAYLRKQEATLGDASSAMRDILLRYAFYVYV